MDQRKSSSPSSSDRRQWQRIFGTLVEMLQSQQSQIETLADERKFMEKYIHILHDRWTSRVRLLESQISQMKKEEVKGRKIQAAKLDLLAEIKQREALCYKKQFELAETDLKDFRACVEALSAELLEPKEKPKCVKDGRSEAGELKSKENPSKGQQCTKALEEEIRKLKHSYKKLSSKKEAEVSALLAEKDFVWNQLKKMESDYTGILKSKKIEVEQTNEALRKLQLNLEDLQASTVEKDKIIADLKARIELNTQEAETAGEKIEQLQINMEELRLLVKEKDETIANLRTNLAKVPDSERNLRNDSPTTLRGHSRKGPRKRLSESAKDDTKQKRRCVYDGSSGSRASAPVHGLERCSSRRRTRTNSSIERPPLFHANFKVPKLKTPPFVV